MNLAKKLLELKLTARGTTFSGKDKSLTEDLESQTGADHGSVKADKLRIPPAYRKELQAPNTAARAWVNEHALRSPFSGRGFHLVKITDMQEVKDTLDAFRMERDTVNRRVCDLWPNVIREAQDMLKGAFNPNDLPPTGDFLFEAFQIDYKFRTLPDPDNVANLLGIDQGSERLMIEKELAEEFAKTLDSARMELYDKLKSPLVDLIEKMNRMNDGTDTKISQTILGNIRKMADIVGKMNKGFLDDDVLRSFALEAYKLSSTDVEVLKGDDTTANEVRKTYSDNAQSLVAKMKEVMG